MVWVVWVFGWQMSQEIHPAPHSLDNAVYAAGKKVHDHILSNITIESIPLLRIVLKFSLHLLLTQVLFRLLERCISLKLDYHLLLFAEKLAKMQFCLQ